MGGSVLLLPLVKADGRPLLMRLAEVSVKVRVEMEVDLGTGVYDVRFYNLDRPGEDIDVRQLKEVATRVFDDVSGRHGDGKPAAWNKGGVN